MRYILFEVFPLVFIILRLGVLLITFEIMYFGTINVFCFMKMKVLQNSSCIWGLGWLGNLYSINMSQYMGKKKKKSPGNQGTGCLRAVGE